MSLPLVFACLQGWAVPELTFQSATEGCGHLPSDSWLLDLPPREDGWDTFVVLSLFNAKV